MADAANTTLKSLAEAKVGDVHGRLTIVDLRAGVDSRGRRLIRCACACGNEGVFDAYNVRKGITKSCGCLCIESRKTRRNRLRHGMTLTRVYRIWAGMKSRCQNENHHAYADYGGRGIKVCERWQLFENFYSDMGDPPPGWSIERTDNDGGYEPGNCCWAAPVQQNNNRRSTKTYIVNGQPMLLKDIACQCGLALSLLRGRLRRGWPIEKAIHTGKLEKWERA